MKNVYAALLSVLTFGAGAVSVWLIAQVFIAGVDWAYKFGEPWKVLMFSPVGLMLVIIVVILLNIDFSVWKDYLERTRRHP